MTIKVRCPSCEKRYSLKPQLSGKKIRCPECSAVITLPEVPSEPAVLSTKRQGNVEASAKASPVRKRQQRAAPPTGKPPGKKSAATVRRGKSPKRGSRNSIPHDAEKFRKWMDDSFSSHSIEPLSTTLAYRLAVVLVAIVMVTLPIIYVGLMGLIGVGTWFAVTALMPVAGPVLGGIASVFLVLTALAIVLFMLKPLFGRPPHTNGRRLLNREEEPLLFEFVERICDIVKAPYPAQIEIDCTIDAAAGFNGGMLSLFSGKLRLSIGLAMVAGLDVRQFAGVLAHEFGHFSQGTGMRVSYLIRSISYWFTRVVYERDAWDDKLFELSQHENGVVRLVLVLTRAGIWLTRKILWLLMLAGHAVSGVLLRQMEYDADRYESRVAGCKSFEATSRKMSLLHVAHEGAIGDLKQFHDEGRLADDLPQLIVVNVEDIPRKVLKKLKKHEEEARTRIFDTHPCHRDRVRNSEQDGSPGIFTGSRPAAELFRKFDMRCRGVTLDFYIEIFGDDFEKKLIRPLSELVTIRRAHLNSLKALRRYFQGNFSWYRCIAMSQDVWDAVDAPPKSTLLANRQEILNLSAKYGKAWKKYSKAEGVLVEAKLARTLIEAGFTINSKTFSIPLRSRGQIRNAVDKMGARQGKSEPTLRAFEEAVSERMSMTLRMARSPELAARLKKKGFSTPELDELLQIYMHISDSIHQLVEIHDQQMILGKLLHLAASGFRHLAILDSIGEQMEFLGEKLSLLQRTFQQVDYPFDHARAGITLAEFAFKTRKLPAFSDPIQLMLAAEKLASSLPVVQARVLGRLCEFAEAVETLSGLTPLEDLLLDDDEEEDDE